MALWMHPQPGRPQRKMSEAMASEVAIMQMHSHSRELCRPVLHLHALPLHNALQCASSSYEKVIIYEANVDRVSFYRAITGGTWRPSDTKDEKKDALQRGFLSMVALVPKPSKTPVHVHRQNEANKWIECAQKSKRNVFCWDDEKGQGCVDVASRVADLRRSVLLVVLTGDDTHKAADMQLSLRPVVLWGPREYEEEQLSEYAIRLKSAKLSAATAISKEDASRALYIPKTWEHLVEPPSPPPSPPPPPPPPSPPVLRNFPGPHNAVYLPRTPLKQESLLSLFRKKTK